METKPAPLKRSWQTDFGIQYPLVPDDDSLATREALRLAVLNPRFSSYEKYSKTYMKSWSEQSVRGVLRCWEKGCVCILGERDAVVCKKGSDLRLEVTTEDKTMFRADEADPDSEDPDKKYPVGEWVTVGQVETPVFKCTKKESRKGEPTHCPVHDFDREQKPTMKIEIGKGSYAGFLFYRCSEGCTWKEIELGIQRRIVQIAFHEWEGKEAFFAKREKEVKDGKK